MFISSRSPFKVLRRPFVRIILLVIVLVIFFVPLFSGPDASPLLGIFAQRPRQPLRSSPFNTPHSEQPSRHRIKTQRPLAEPGDDGPWAQRADAVRGAFLHAYNGYLTHAAPHDELLPIEEGFVDNMNGWGLTIVESLDTMWLMGLYDEFDAGLAFVANMTFSMEDNNSAPFFETVIRYLGGLLSAYALSKDPILLARADDLGTALLPVFGTPTGLPMSSVNTVNGRVYGGDEVAFAEMLTCQLEYKYLSYLTGRKEYYDAVEKIMDVVYKANVTSLGELFPPTWSRLNGSAIGRSVGIGGTLDSGYEYMLKQWLLTGRTDTKARDLYVRSMDAILDHLTYLSPSRNLLYVTDAQVELNGAFTPSHKLEHLSCFLPNVLALGAVTLPDAPQRHMWAARAFAQTCAMLYADSPSGLAPDEVMMMRLEDSTPTPWVTQLEKWERSGGQGDPPGVGPVAPVSGDGGDTQREYWLRNRSYFLRPETVESFYLLWRTTGDVVWRERGWDMFEALQREARVESGGFASIWDAYTILSDKRDVMQSWFLAETLKYLFLLFTDEDLVPLDQWVFNTEAHPLPVFHWSKWEMERLGIAIGV